jgi:hypothetical protein
MSFETACDCSMYEPEENNNSGKDIDMVMDDISTAASPSMFHKKFIILQSALLSLFMLSQMCQEGGLKIALD